MFYQVNLYPISDELILLAFNDNTDSKAPTLNLYLFKINYKLNECRVVDQKQIGEFFDLQKIVFDQMNRQKFVLISNNNVMNGEGKI